MFGKLLLDTLFVQDDIKTQILFISIFTYFIFINIQTLRIICLTDYWFIYFFV